MVDFKTFIDTNIKDKKTFIFVSPHFDDAVFSAGGLLYYLYKNKAKLKVVNVFTKASSPPYTFSARRNLRLSKFSSAIDLYKVREKEDSETLRKLNVKIYNLGFCDALFRKKSLVNKSASRRIFPEMMHVYPIYVFHLTRGVISKEDRNLLNEIEIKLKRIVNKSNVIVFCPLAYKSHIDHVIVNKICRELRKDLVLWEDFPYNINKGKRVSSGTNKDRVSVHLFNEFQDKRKNLIEGYRTQSGSLIKNGKLFMVPETYYFINK